MLHRGHVRTVGCLHVPMLKGLTDSWSDGLWLVLTGCVLFGLKYVLPPFLHCKIFLHASVKTLDRVNMIISVAVRINVSSSWTFSSSSSLLVQEVILYFTYQILLPLTDFAAGLADLFCDTCLSNYVLWVNSTPRQLLPLFLCLTLFNLVSLL